jgi:hypothetical protein
MRPPPSRARQAWLPSPDEATVAGRPSSLDGFLKRLEQRPGLSALVALATFAALFVGVLAAVPDWRDMLSGEEPPPAAQALLPEPSSTYPTDTSAVSALDLVVRDPGKTGDRTTSMPRSPRLPSRSPSKIAAAAVR